MPTSHSRLVQQYMRQGMSQAAAEEKAAQRYAQQHHGQKPPEQPRRRRKNEDYSSIINNFLVEKTKGPKGGIWGPEAKAAKGSEFNNMDAEERDHEAEGWREWMDKRKGEYPEIDKIKVVKYESFKTLNNITEGFLTWLTGLANKGVSYQRLDPPTPPKQTATAAAAEKSKSNREQAVMQHAGFTNKASLGYVDSPAYYRKLAGAEKISKETRKSAENLGVLPSTKFKPAPHRPFKDAPKGGHWSAETGLHTISGHERTPSPGQEKGAQELKMVQANIQSKLDQEVKDKEFNKTFVANRNARYHRAYNAVESFVKIIKDFLVEERAPGIARDPEVRAKILDFMRKHIIGQKATEIPHHKETAPGASFDANISSADDFEFKPKVTPTKKDLSQPEGPEWDSASSYRERKSTNFVDAGGKDVPKATVIGGLTPEKPPERTGVTHVSGRMFTKAGETALFKSYANQARDIANLPSTVAKQEKDFITGIASKTGKKTITYPAKTKSGEIENKTTVFEYPYVSHETKQKINTPAAENAFTSFNRQLATHLAKAAMLRTKPGTHIADIQKMAAKFGSTKPK